MLFHSDALRFSAGDIRLALALVAYILVLAVLPVVLPEDQFRWTFSEAGPFEQFAIIAWLFAALVVVVRIRPLGPRAWAFAVLCVLFAAREADWHKAFTADSLLKSNYYRHTVAPLSEKMLAGMVAVAAIAVILYVGFVIARFLLRQGGWRSRAGIWLMFATALVLAGKVLDRAPAVLFEEFGIALSPLVGHYAAAFEEGMEAIHALLLAWAVWISQTEKRFLS
ncbi:hypothetical protein GCM10027343_21880 [Noviherbaspirillum agri]